MAETLRAAGWRCAFAALPTSCETLQGLANFAYETLVLDSNEDNESQALAQKYPGGVDLLVVDHYGRDANFERACRPWARQILVVDDLANRSHDCALLLDQTPGQCGGDYKTLIPSDCQMLVGPDYALLRPQFLAARGSALARRHDGVPVQRILINMGAVDAPDATGLALDAIIRSGLAVDVDVILGTNAPHRDAVLAQTERLGRRMRVHLGVRDVARLMCAADLAIGAAGSASLERCTLGLPTLVLVTAENQWAVARGLDVYGATENLGWHESVKPASLAERLKALCADYRRRVCISERAAELCDARGTTRVLLKLVGTKTARDGRPVRLRLATAADEGIMFDWQCHPLTRRFARNPNPPTSVEHHHWLSSQLVSYDCILMIIEHADSPTGVLRLDRRSDVTDGPAFEVSILVAPDRRRFGLGLAALQLGRKLFPGALLVAELLQGNEASEALFKAAGYERGDDGLFYGRAASANSNDVRRA